MGAGVGPIGAIFGAAGGVLNFGQATLEGQALEREAAFSAKQQEFNAKLARLNAEDAILRGEKLAESVRRQKRQTIGAQRAAFAAQGIAIDAVDESTGQLQEDVEIFAALDELQARENAAQTARAFEMDAVQAEAQARFTRAAAKQQAAAGKFRALTGIATGALSGFAGDISSGRVQTSQMPSISFGDLPQNTAFRRLPGTFIGDSIPARTAQGGIRKRRQESALREIQKRSHRIRLGRGRQA